MHNACTIFCLTKAKVLPASPDSLFSFPNRSLPMSQWGGQLSAADSGRKMHTQKAQEIQLKQVCNVNVCCTWVHVYNAADCAIIPYHLKCIMRSSEVPLTSLCLMASVNFSQLCENTCKHCNVKHILPYLELRPCRLMICDHPKTACDCWWPWDSAYWSDPLLLDIEGDSPPFTHICFS